MPAPTAVPASPVPDEALVSQTAPIVADLLEGVAGVDPATVMAAVNGTPVYDGSIPAFLGGWTGSVVARPQGDGLRLVLVAPVPFPDGRVDVLLGASSLDTTAMPPFGYSFFVQLRQITLTGDAQGPRVAEVDPTTVWLAYARAGQVVLRRMVSGVLSGETNAVPGDLMDVGYDPTLNKFVLLYSNNGKIFYVLGDPGDVPATLPQPSTLRTETRGYFSGAEDPSSPEVLTFTPIKLVPPVEAVDGNQYLSGSEVGLPPARGPTGPSSSVIIVPNGQEQPLGTPWLLRFFPPGSGYDRTQLLGFNLYKMVAGHLHVAMFVPFSTALPEFTEVTDPAPVPNALYGVSTVVREDSGQVLEGPPGSFIVPPQRAQGIADTVREYLSGSEDATTVVVVTFTPAKLAPPAEIVNGDQYLSGSEVLFASVSGFDPIGVG